MDGFTEKILDKDGCTIHYWTGGRPGTPWLVFLHGVGEDHRTFYPQMPDLAGRYRILTMDIRGHGRSRPMGAFSVPLAADDLHAVMIREGIETAGLIGQSLGGNIAQEMAYVYSPTVRCLALIGSLCNTMKYTCLQTLMYRRIAPCLLPLYPWRVGVALIATMSAVEPTVQDYLIEAAMVMGKRDYNTVLRETLACPRYEEGYHIGKPLLLACGEKDIGLLKRIASRWAAAEPSGEFHIIPRAAHCANQDNPAAFNGLLLGFLSKCHT